MVMNAAALCGRRLTDDQVEQLARVLMPEVSSAVRIFEGCLRRVLVDQAEPMNQGNVIWDMYYALLSASTLGDGTVPIMLVTDDGEIARASTGPDETNRVISRGQYEPKLLTMIRDASQSMEKPPAATPKPTSERDGIRRDP
jgi:hypothetical protein